MLPSKITRFWQWNGLGVLSRLVNLAEIGAQRRALTVSLRLDLPLEKIGLAIEHA